MLMEMVHLSTVQWIHFDNFHFHLATFYDDEDNVWHDCVVLQNAIDFRRFQRSWQWQIGESAKYSALQIEIRVNIRFYDFH